MHIPVLLEETVETLKPKSEETVLDGTLGGGGHAERFIESVDPGGTFIGIDLSQDALDRTEKKLKEFKEEKDLNVSLNFFQDNFKNIKSILTKNDFSKLDALFLDLGLSSDQIEQTKGFSYRDDEPLVMRYDEDVSGFTAARFLNEYSEKQIAEIIKEYGEERFADRIANQIAKKRREEKLRTTSQLKEAIREALPKNYSPDKHPAMRTFLAIRIFINEELKNLKRVISDLDQIMKSKGRVGIISYNSLEDRIVKEGFQELVDQEQAEFIEELITPEDQEVESNPRSRSAKLRAIKFLK